MTRTNFKLLKSKPVAKGVALLDDEPSDLAQTRAMFRTGLETAWANPGRWVEIKFGAEAEVSAVRPAFATILGPGNAKRRESSLFIRAEHGSE